MKGPEEAPAKVGRKFEEIAVQIEEYTNAVDAIDDLVGRVFGRAAGGNPDVYGGDYDDFLALSGKCRAAVAALRTAAPSAISVDIGPAYAALQASPELGEKIMELIVGPMVVEAMRNSDEAVTALSNALKPFAAVDLKPKDDRIEVAAFPAAEVDSVLSLSYGDFYAAKAAYGLVSKSGGA